MKNYELKRIIKISKTYGCEFYKVINAFKFFGSIDVVETFLYEVAYAKFKRIKNAK